MYRYVEYIKLYVYGNLDTLFVCVGNGVMNRVFHILGMRFFNNMYPGDTLMASGNVFYLFISSSQKLSRVSGYFL